MRTAQWQELARLDACEVLESPLASEVTYQRAVALVCELLDELLPAPRSQRRSLPAGGLASSPHSEAPNTRLPITYFDLWMARFMGYLPDISECLTCGRALKRKQGIFSRARRLFGMPGAASGWRHLRCRVSREKWRRRC